MKGKIVSNESTERGKHSRSGSKNTNFDFSGLKEFWKIVSILEKDEKPSEEDWKSLFETPGYRILIEEEFPVGFFEKYFTLAFTPSRAEDMRSEMEKEGLVGKYLNHYVRVRDKRDEIRKQEERLRTTPIMKEVLDYAREYLPEDAIPKYPAPTISFVIFGPDARGYSPIVMDILFTIDMNDCLPLLLAHEIHHYYRNRSTEFIFPEKESADSYIFWTINQIHLEGVADMIDKRRLFFRGGTLENTEWAEEYRGYLEEIPNVIKDMNELLGEYNGVHDEKTRKNIADRLLKTVPMSGHPLGYYMAEKIIENSGKEQLIREIGSPFAFFRLYNRTAETDGSEYPAFSRKAMNTLSELESKYALKR